MMNWALATIQEILLMKMQGDVSPAEDGPLLPLPPVNIALVPLGRVFRRLLSCGMDVTALVLIEESRT